MPIFALLRLTLPWSRWAELGWGAPGLVFVGWFGPMGASAVLLAMFALHGVGDEHVWTLGSLLIASSVVAHGVTATPVTALYRDAGGRSSRAA
jgi:NhaP-type Na+/H+ or K+/H+ antiporter